MKRIISIVIALIMLLGCACAENMTAELWQHEAGWISFSVALAQDGMEDVWEESAKVFGGNLGLNLTGSQLKMMMMQGYALENGVDDLSIEGNHFTGRTKDGAELFSHEYSWVETLEEADIMGGKKVYVFKTEEADANEYTYLLMTEPIKTESENTAYVTFNLFHTQKDAYRDLFDAKKTGTAAMPCAMIEKDTGRDGLAYAIVQLYTSPIALK